LVFNYKGIKMRKSMQQRIKDLGMKQTFLAEKLGVSETVMSIIINRENTFLELVDFIERREGL
jgi:hypothetical protein